MLPDRSSDQINFKIRSGPRVEELKPLESWHGRQCRKQSLLPIAGKHFKIEALDRGKDTASSFSKVSVDNDIRKKISPRILACSDLIEVRVNFWWDPTIAKAGSTRPSPVTLCSLWMESNWRCHGKDDGHFPNWRVHCQCSRKVLELIVLRSGNLASKASRST